MPQPDTTLYFHAQCFDGVVSAVVARSFLVEQLGWAEPQLIAVGYARQHEWLKTAFGPHTAIVDFLFHPEAEFWADHHETSFLAVRPERMQPLWFFDPTADSCAGLLARALSNRALDVARYSEAIAWAERIDAARYASPEEAILARGPALIVNASLADASPADCSELVRFLSRESLTEAARLSSVLERASSYVRRVESGLALVRPALTVEDGIAKFVVRAPPDAVIHRYAPYLYARDVCYSAGLIGMPDRIRLSVMRNPWREFESVNLGKLCARFGGGGHQRVGAVSFPADAWPRAINALNEIEHTLRAQPMPADT